VINSGFIFSLRKNGDSWWGFVLRNGLFLTVLLSQPFLAGENQEPPGQAFADIFVVVF
jgi:hypothetical protein